MSDHLPMVIPRSQLMGLDTDGRACETCDELMRDHEWALLNAEGFVIFCSNLVFDRRGEREVYSSRKYIDAPGNWEDQEFIHIGGIIDPREVAYSELHKYEEDPTQIYIKVSAYRQYIFKGNEEIVLELDRNKND